MRRVDAALHEPSRLGGRQLLGGVIRLLRPSLIYELDTAPVDYDKPFIRRTDRDQRGPAGMRFEAGCDSHHSPIVYSLCTKPPLNDRVATCVRGMSCDSAPKSAMPE